MPVRKKKIYLAAMLCALAVAVGYAFVYIPNVEFITAAVFINGCILGRFYGVLTAMTAEFLFSAFNPMGAAAPPMLLAQALCFGLTGYMGGVVRQRQWQDFSAAAKIAYFGILGFVLTLVYDVLTTLSFSLFLAGSDSKKILASFVSGMGFYVIHVMVNTTSFALIVPVILQRLDKMGFLYKK